MDSVDTRFRRFILYGITFDAVQNLFRPFALMYLERLGAASWQIFLFSSLPALFSAFALLPAVLLVRRLKDEQAATSLFFLASRVFLLAFIAIPALPEAIRPMAFVVLFSLAAMPEAAGLSGLQSFIGHVFKPEERSRAIARRSRYGIPLVLLITISTGLILRYLPGSDASRITLYQITFGLAFVGGLAELWFLRRIQGPKSPAHEEPLSFKATLRSIVTNKPFLGFFAASLTFHFAWQLGWPLFSVWQVKHLKADEAWFALFTVIGAVTMFFGYGFWDKFQRKFGIHVALVACTLGQAMNPFFIASATNLWWQAVFNVFTAFFTAGVGSVFLSALLATTPDGSLRIMHLAVYNTVLYLSQVLSQQLGHWLHDLVGVRTAIYIDGGLRLVGSFAFFINARFWLRRGKEQAIGIGDGSTEGCAQDIEGNLQVCEDPGVSTIESTKTLT